MCLKLGAVELTLLAAMAGCSHTSPYFRSDIVPPVTSVSPHEAVRQRILLAGDAGDTKVSREALGVLTEWASDIPDRTLVVFLGDNIYPAGMPAQEHPTRAAAEESLDAQLAVITSSGARGFFISGNHDWADDGEGGLDAVRRQEEYVNAALGCDGNFLPAGGCGIPAKIELNGVRVVALNTAWWLHSEGLARQADPQAEKTRVIEAIESTLTGVEGLDVVVVSHHPLASHGTHGGFYDWKDHLFPSTHLVEGLWIPTPVIGSLYPLLRSLVFNRQTLAGTEYTDMRMHLTKALATNPPLVYAAGHDHGLQVLEGGSAAEYYLVSALGLDVGASMGHGKDTLFAHLHAGFMVLDFMESGTVLLRVVEQREEEVAFSMWMK